MRLVFDKKLSQAVGIYVHILLSWQSIITFGLCSLGALLYYTISWKPLQLFWARIIVEILEFGGHSASRIHNDIFMGSAAIRIGSPCTYIPLILIGFPFVWRGDRLIRDVFRIIFFVTAVSVANAIRLYFTIVWLAKGMAWKYAHDLLNHFTYAPILVLIVLLWLRSMRLRLTRKSEIINEKQPSKRIG
jgi:hypothetical protein